MSTFTVWEKPNSDSRIYVTPNTAGRAFISLLKSGQPRVHSTEPNEINSTVYALSQSGVNMQTAYDSFESLVSALKQAGHQVNGHYRRPQPELPNTPSGNRSKEDFANTLSPTAIYRDTLKYTVASIKFNRSIDQYLITVDTREPGSLLDRLSASRFSVVSKKLDVGDIRITSTETNDELIIERKTVSDLYSSVIAHTAHRQAECLFEYQASRAQEGVRVMVVWLIEGELDGQRMLYNAFPGTNQTDGVVNFLTGILGQHVIQCYGQHHLCYMAIKLCQGFFEQELVVKVKAAERKTRTPTAQRTALLGHSSGKYHGVRTQDKNTLMQVLLSIPSLKEPAAKHIMSQGHRLKDVLNYTFEDWVNIDGIGKITAEKIMQEISQL